MSLLYLVRHGQASAGTHDYDRLSPLGQHQSELLGRWWTDQGFAPEHLYHGSLLRQRDTARLALQHLDSSLQTSTHEGLNEYKHRVIDKHFGQPRPDDQPESMTFDDYVGIMQRWRDHPSESGSSDIEPWAEFSARGWQTIVDLHAQQADKTHHVFFTSGGIIATVMAAVLGLDFAHTIDAIWRIRNSSITTIHFEGTHARLIDFNTIPHLQAQHDASLITLI